MTVGAAVLLSQVRKVWVSHPSTVGNLIVDCELLLYANSCCAFMSEAMRRHRRFSSSGEDEIWEACATFFFYWGTWPKKHKSSICTPRQAGACASAAAATSKLDDSDSDWLFVVQLSIFPPCAVGGLWDCAKDVNHLAICDLKIIWIAKFLNQIWNRIKVFQFFLKLNCVMWFNRTSN